MKPFTISVEAAGAGYIAYNKDVHVWAYGDSPADALRDFGEQLVHHFFFWQSKAPDKVTGLGAKLRLVYAEHFTEDGLLALASDLGGEVKEVE